MSFHNSIVAYPLQKEFWDHALLPWQSDNEELRVQVGYWITFFVVGLITAFIPHLIYYSCLCCDHSPSASKEKRTNPRFSLESEPPSLFFEEDPPFDAFSVAPQADPPSTHPLFESDGAAAQEKKLESLERLRKAQGISPAPKNNIPTLRMLAMRILATEAEKSKKAVNIYEGEVLSLNAAELFASDSSFNEGRVIGALNLPEVRQLDLRGSGMTLTEKVLFHPHFTSLNFIGCKFSDPERLTAAIAEQKNLEGLSLCLEQPITQSDFQKITTSCPKLKRLTAAVKLDGKRVFTSPSNIEHLTLRAASLTATQLNNLLISCPHLKKLTLWIDDQKERINFGIAIRDFRPNDLKCFEVIYDSSSPLLTKPLRGVVEGVNVYFTQLDTPSLLGLTTERRASNFWDYSFAVAVSRFSYDCEKMQMLLKQTAQNFDSSSPDPFIARGRSLANLMTTHDLNALAKVFEPFSSDFGDKTLSYNLNLELILRAAIEFCDQKITNELDIFSEKKKILLLILKKFDNDSPN